MSITISSPWSASGRSAQPNWHALQRYTHFLARRIGERDEWIICVGEERCEGPWPGNDRGQLGTFGHLGYELKNEVEHLGSRHVSGDGFANGAWWKARFVIALREDKAELRTEPSFQEEGERLLNELLEVQHSGPLPQQRTWLTRTSKAAYLERIGSLIAHIQRGDIYEVNYCTERTAELSGFDPYAGFSLLFAHSQAPFAAFYRSDDQFALCASPERFLRLEDDHIVTQPIKGTRRRGTDPQHDKALALELAQDPKERSENIMAVDVARNDLSRIAASGSVRVDELCAVRTFPNVHQLVSTVSAKLRQGLSAQDLLRATFPMASMTGAPKVRAMQLIDEVEDMQRGLFSGSLGFFLPDGTADLNVVIRTVTYNSATGHASLISGGAITAASDPDAEWEECIVKARSVLNAWGHAC